MADSEQQKQKHLEFQFYQEQLQSVSQQLELLTQQRAELDISIEAVRQIQKTALQTELWAPLANGIFVKGALQDNQTLLVNVGSDVTVEKTPAQVRELLRQHKKDLELQLMETDALLQQLNAEALRIYKELEQG